MASFAHIFALVLSSLPAYLASDCVWDRDSDFPAYPSLIMDKATWTSVLPLMETGQRIIRISSGATVVLACPETTILATNTDVVEAFCEGGDVLNVGGSSYNMTELGCESRLKESILKNVGSCAGGDEHSIGYDVTGYDFYELMRVCFDPILENCLSSKHILRGASIEASDTNPSRPSFKVDSGFYTVSVNTCYEQDSQMALLEQLLGKPGTIDVSESLYFARGHMAPDADFCTEMESDATYYYINAAPQWQTFNNGNWKALEFSVRDLVQSYGRDFEITTGTYNILPLQDINANPVDIYLGLTQDEKVLPAPDVTWKVIYDPVQNKAVSVIGSNNPYLEQFPSPICTDICDKIAWVDWDVTNIGHGATYCCTVEDLRAVVPNAPNYPNAGLLDS